MLAVLCAILASGMYAAASVLQQRTASAESHDHSLRLGLLARLVRNPLWLLGVAADVAGFALQFVALGNGTLVVVQPLLVCGLLFALPIGAHWGGCPLRARDWLGALAVCAGLAVFLLVAKPARGHDNVHIVKWLVLGGIAGTLCAILLTACRGRTLRQRAVLLSGVAGVTYGVTAALTKTCAHLLTRGFPVLFEHWQFYALIILGVGGMVISQSAFQAGSLDASLPTMTVVDPIVSIIIGAVAFGETLDVAPGITTLEITALLVMTVGVFFLARTPAVRGLHPGLVAGGAEGV